MADMSSSTTSKRSHKSKLPPYVGSVHEELEAPFTSEIVFRKIWTIKKFRKTIMRRELVDSPDFRCSVNDVTTHWNMSIRFWKGPTGKKIFNPVVLCLNLTGCNAENTGQTRIRFQFGAWDTEDKRWDCCSISTVVIHLENKHELHSIGYETLKIANKHYNSDKDVSIMVKIQVIPNEEEKHSLSQDLSRILNLQSQDNADTVVECLEDHEVKSFKAHSVIIRARSQFLSGQLIKHNDEKDQTVTYKLDFRDLSYSSAYELFRYLYSDKVDNLEVHAIKLLPISTRFHIPGLTTLCERALLESLSPNNVANILLLADQCNCDNLRKAALQYCEESPEIRESLPVEKTLAWRVMEMVNPELFLEACESLGSSSSNLSSSSLSD